MLFIKTALFFIVVSCVFILSCSTVLLMPPFVLFIVMLMLMLMLMLLSHVIPYAKHPLEIPPFNRFSDSTSDSFV